MSPIGYSDRGSLYPRTERPGGHWMGGSLKPTTPGYGHDTRTHAQRGYAIGFVRLSVCQFVSPVKNF